MADPIGNAVPPVPPSSSLYKHAWRWLLSKLLTSGTEGLRYDPWLRYLENALMLVWFLFAIIFSGTLILAFLVENFGSISSAESAAVTGAACGRFLDGLSKNWIALVVVAFPLLYRSLRRYAENLTGKLGESSPSIGGHADLGGQNVGGQNLDAGQRQDDGL